MTSRKPGTVQGDEDEVPYCKAFLGIKMPARNVHTIGTLFAWLFAMYIEGYIHF